MKMKQVIAETGLTDRAVRLYISKGLVFPDVKEKYSGRRDFEFSLLDVHRLKQIALLRKAGFSLGEIEHLISSDGDIRAVIEAFVQTKKAQIEADARVVSILEDVLAGNTISLDDICTKLSQQAQPRPLPREDITTSKAERMAVKGFSVFYILIAVLNTFAPVIYILILISDVRYFMLKWQITPMLFFCLPWLINLCICVGFTVGMHRRKLRTARFFVLCSAAAILAAAVLIASIHSCIFGMITTPVSVTENPKNYMKTDSFIRECEYYDEICELFPAKIPGSAAHTISMYSKNSFPTTTVYYYHYAFIIDPDFDIVAEWRLPEDEYAAAKEKAALLSEYVVNEGNWSVYPHRSSTEIISLKEPKEFHDRPYFYLLFACNDQTQTVRYITAYAVDAVEPPYFYKLNW